MLPLLTVIVLLMPSLLSLHMEKAAPNAATDASDNDNCVAV
jgi:hypothetical protein